MKKHTTPRGPRFVVYTLCYPNGKPFYVGKGSPARPYAHESEARRGCPCPKCDVIRSIWKAGNQIQRVIVFTTNDEHEAVIREGDEIALYNLDTLTNKNVGYGYVRDRNKAVPKETCEGVGYNQTSPERLQTIIDSLIPSLE